MVCILGGMELSQAEFARLAGVTRGAINSKVKRHILIQNCGGKLDTDNVTNRAYLERKESERQNNIENGVEVTTKQNVFREDAKKPVPEEKPQRVERIVQGSGQNGNAGESFVSTGLAGRMLDMTVRELVTQHGSIANVGAYVKILRDLSAADEREQKTQERRQVVVPKDFTIARLFSYLNQINSELLDLPEMMVDPVIALVQADDENKRNKIIVFLRESMVRALSGAKEHIQKEFNGLKGKYDERDDLSDLYDTVERLQDNADG